MLLDYNIFISLQSSQKPCFTIMLVMLQENKFPYDLMIKHGDIVSCVAITCIFVYAILMSLSWGNEKAEWDKNELSLLFVKIVSPQFTINRSSRPEVFLRKGVLKICSMFIGEHPCRSLISIKLQSKFIEIKLWHGCCLVNLLHIFITPFPKDTFGWLLLNN